MSATAISRAPALTSDQERLVRLGLPVVEACATEIARRYRGLVTREELLAPGTIALREAALAYREERHPSFPCYARHHIQGRMIDALRAEHFSPSARLERAMDRAYERHASHQTLDFDLFADDEETLLDGTRLGVGDALAAAHVAALIEDQRMTLEDAIVEDEAESAVIASLLAGTATLPPHERTVIELVYERGLTLDEAAGAIGVHVNTAQRRHVSALRKLRAYLLRRGIGNDSA